jgi:hypothetical protein
MLLRRKIHGTISTIVITMSALVKPLLRLHVNANPLRKKQHYKKQ